MPTFQILLKPCYPLRENSRKKGLLVQQGNRLKYIDSKGKEHIDFRKAWVGDKLDMIMADFKEVMPTEQEQEVKE